MPNPKAVALKESIETAMDDITSFTAVVDAHGEAGSGATPAVIRMKAEFKGSRLLAMEMEGGEGSDYLHCLFVDDAAYYETGQGTDLYLKMSADSENPEVRKAFGELMAELEKQSDVFGVGFLLVARDLIGYTTKDEQGRSTTKYTFDADLSAIQASGLSAEDADMAADLSAMRAFGAPTIPVVIWVDEGGRMFRYSLLLPTSKGTMTVTTTLTNLNKPVTVLAPDPEQVTGG